MKFGHFIAVRILEFVCGGLIVALSFGLFIKEPFVEEPFIEVIEDSYKAVLFYEVFTLYLPITLIVWVVVALSRKARWLMVSIPVLFLLHSSLVAGAFYQVDRIGTWSLLSLSLAIGSMAFVDACLGYLFLGVHMPKTDQGR